MESYHNHHRKMKGSKASKTKVGRILQVVKQLSEIFQTTCAFQYIKI